MMVVLLHSCDSGEGRMLEGEMSGRLRLIITGQTTPRWFTLSLFHEVLDKLSDCMHSFRFRLVNTYFTICFLYYDVVVISTPMK